MKKHMSYWDLLRRIENKTNPQQVEFAGRIYKYLFGAYRDEFGITLDAMLGAFNGGGKWKYQPSVGYEAGLLDDNEKDYIRAVLKPYKVELKYVEKRSVAATAITPAFEFIHIDYNYVPSPAGMPLGGSADLPVFEKSSMFICLEPKRKYSKKELGL